MEQDKILILCLASGSDGNCYAFVKNDEVVLVECGIDYGTISKKLINYGILPTKITTVICTHRHKDHTLALADLGRRFVQMHYSKDIMEDGDVVDGAKIKLTDWLSVYCFKVNHDVEAYGFAFLDTENKQSILFINDTAEFEFPLKNVLFDIVMIECNYIQTQLDAIRRTAKSDFKYGRQERTHLSLLGTKNMLSQMNLKQTKVIILMHLSHDCANETAMKNEIHTVYKIRTLVAKREGGID